MYAIFIVATLFIKNGNKNNAINTLNNKNKKLKIIDLNIINFKTNNTKFEYEKLSILDVQ